MFFGLFVLTLFFPSCVCTIGTYRLGYPACGCKGYVWPTISFLLNLISLTCLAISLPFTMQKLGNAIDDWSCVTSATLNTAVDLAVSVQNTSELMFAQVNSQVNATVDTIYGALDQVEHDTLAINSTIEALSHNMYSGCTTITASQSYESLSTALKNGGGSATIFDCNSVKQVAPKVSADIKQVDSTIDQARVEVANTYNDAVSEIVQAQVQIDNTINEFLSDIHGLGNQIFGLTVDVPVDLGPLLSPGSYSIAGLTSWVAYDLPLLGLALCSTCYLAALFWWFGISALMCAQCELNKRNKKREAAAVGVRANLTSVSLAHAGWKNAA